MALTVANNKRTFLKDGKPFFYLADTCWSAFTNITDDDWEYYLQYRKRQGYNVLQINILPQWDASATDLNYVPYECDENGKYRFDKINDAYFEHAQSMCKKAKLYGFELALVVLWCNYVPDTWANAMDNTKTMPFEDIDAYVKKVNETFSMFDPMYMISGDTDLNTERTISYYSKASDLLRQEAPNHLQTLHIKGRLMEVPMELIDRIDFYMFQSGHNAQIENRSMPYALAENFHNNYPAKPSLNSEPCYEQMGYSHNMYGRFHGFDIRRAAWQSLLSGACAGVTYGAAGIYSWHMHGKGFGMRIGEGFDCPNPWHIALHYPGAWDYGDIQNILKDYHVEQLLPKQEVLLNKTDEIRVATTGQEKDLIIYVPENTTVRLDLHLDEASQVIIIDMETRHKEQGRIYYENGVCCIGMHIFAHDALYIVKGVS